MSKDGDMDGITREKSASTALNRAFAAAEEVGVRVGVVFTLIGFALYTTGVVAPFLSIETLVHNWGGRAEDLVRETGWPTGWGWAAMLEHSDMLSLAGLILLSSVVIAAYLVLLVLLLRQRNRTYAAIVLLQLLVFALAASGLVGGGH